MSSESQTPGPRPLTTPTPLPWAAPPATTVRIDTTSSATPGRFGLSEPMIQIGSGFQTSAHLLRIGAIGVLTTPEDLNEYRMNIGIRTLFKGATVLVRTFDASGKRLGTVEHHFPSTWFVQMDAAAFTVVPLPPNGSIHIQVTRGEAITYGVTVNNLTQDGSLQFATHLNGGVTALAGAQP